MHGGGPASAHQKKGGDTLELMKGGLSTALSTARWTAGSAMAAMATAVGGAPRSPERAADPSCEDVAQHRASIASCPPCGVWPGRAA